MSQEPFNFCGNQVDNLPGENNEVSLSQEILTPSLQEWLLATVPLDIPTMEAVMKVWSSEYEDVIQTSNCIDSNPFPGKFSFHIHIEDSESKQYTYSEKLNRLYCNMDRAVPITLKWEGTSISHVRAMLVFKDPDHLNSPVYRCRTHNDETCGTNQGCKHFRHIVRCDNQYTVYKENANSKRHSVATLLLGSNQIGWNEVKGIYRFMCNTTCNGVDAIARRRTDLVLTLEDSNYKVVGRAVVGVKICSCPHRDKRRDEEDGDSRKKKVASKRKREPDSNIVDVVVLPAVVPPSPANGSTMTTYNVPNGMVKREVEGEASDYMDLQVTIPNFPCCKVEEFQSTLKRLVASYYIADDDVNAATFGVQINEASKV